MAQTVEPPKNSNATAAGNREAKLTHVNNGTIHQMLVYRDGRCVGWCQYGPPAEVATIKNPKAYEKGLAELPDWRIGCLFTGSGSRRKGVARAGLAAVLSAIAHAGGGLVEAYPEQVDGRDPQRGRRFRLQSVHRDRRATACETRKSARRQRCVARASRP